MARTFLPEYVAMTMAWFAALGCITGAILLIMIWPSSLTWFTSTLFILSGVYQIYVAVIMWTKIR